MNKYIEWEEKKKTKAQEQNYICEQCGSICRNRDLSGFVVHHKTYTHLGDEPLSNLMFLCQKCHIKLHIENYR